MRKNFTLLICLILFGFSSSIYAQVVMNGNDSGAGSLRAAINAAAGGEIITFDGSVSTVTLSTGDLDIDVDLTIDGNSSVSIDANDTSRIFNITNGDVSLIGLTITDGTEVQGGGIYITNANVSISNCEINNNTADGDATSSGGGIFLDTGGTLDIADSNIDNNSANRAGGGIEDATGAGLSLTLNNVGFFGNSAFNSPGNGGAIHITGAGSSSITGGNIGFNDAAREGGAFWNGSGTMTISGSQFLLNTANGNDADEGGGAIYNNGGNLIINNGAVISTNSATGEAGSGGGILNNLGTLTISDSSILSNTANRAGGGIEEVSDDDQESILTNVEIRSNSADGNLAVTSTAPGNGGGIHVTGSGTIRIIESIVSANTAAAEGGGLWNGSGVMSINSTDVTFNIASGDASDQGGGGVYNLSGFLRVINASRITDNVADGAAGSGGGILNDVGGFLRIANSNVLRNRANRAGGGIEDNSGLTTTTSITNSFIRLNNVGVSPAVASPGNGGGLHVSGDGDVEIVGGIIGTNIAALEGGGLWNSTGTMTITGTEIRFNTASGDASDQGGGGIYNAGGTLTISDGALIHTNTADGSAGSGGGILNDTGGSIEVSESSIYLNQAMRAGGGIEDNSGAGLGIVLMNVDLYDNTTGSSPGNGGGLHITGAGDAMITGGTVTGNMASSEGGGLWNGSGSMEIDNVSIDGNTASGDTSAEGGGGIYNLSGTVTISNDSAITNNVADGAAGSGGGILNDTGGNIDISDTLISGNSSVRAGGGIEDNSGAGLGVTLSNVSLNNNSTASSPGNGGGLHVTGAGDVNINTGTVNGNTASSEGGGLWNGSGTMTIDGTTIDGNIASGDMADEGGGGIYNLSGTVSVLNATVSNNTADGSSGSGGGILNDVGGTINVVDSEISTNSSMRAGGGIEDNSGAGLGISLNNVDLMLNSTGSSPGNGGGLHITGAGDANINGGNVTGNTASSEGGGLWNGTGTMNISAVSIENNTASGAAADNGGGGVYNNGGFVNIDQTTFSNNDADGTAGAGGAIHNGDGGTLTLFRSTVSANSSTGAGGGVANTGADASIDASTIAFNTAGGIGGGVAGVTNVSLKNTIVANNVGSSGSDVAGTLTSNGYNLISTDDANAFPAQGTDIEGQLPLLGPLADNGGPTMTHSILNASPAYNAGDPTDLFPDQRGEAVFDGVRDIGSFEAQANLSIADFSDVAVSSIYPNPTTGKFYVEVGNTATDKLNLRITSMTGQVVGDYNMSVGRNEININGMSAGIYLLNISDGNNKISHKLILR